MLRVRASAFIKLLATFALGGFLMLTVATNARANMAARQPENRPGDAPHEPAGGLKSVHILRETLVIDLRPLKETRPAVVEASYLVRNDGEAKDLELIFIAAGMQPGRGLWRWRGRDWVEDTLDGAAAIESGVWLDGQRVESRAEADASGLPPQWSPPVTTPRLKPGAGGLPYKVLSNGTLVFRVSLAPGEHTFRVRYAARPGAFSGTDSDAVYWQLGYVLAPAREWASFGGLDAKVLLPEGWRAAASPEMKREGDALVASWDAIPADALAITAQTNERTVSDEGAFWQALIIQGVIYTALAALAGWGLGRWLGRRGRTGAWALPFAPVVAVLLVCLSYVIATAVASPRAPRQAAFNEIGNYDGIVTVFLVVLITGWHFVVTLAATFIARRNTSKLR
jgi:hypothetical protein